MIVYFDTSALVPIVIEEATSGNATRLWREAERVISSRLIYAEARAALAMARPLNRLGEQELRDAVDGLDSLIENLDMVEVTEELVRHAGTLAETLHLRGYDAVHVASAERVKDRDLVVASGDENLLEAAKALRLSVANLRDLPS
ncbi:MAG: type II toxin-antitoxin system VapC family toxin [Actinomycetota bacterium]|nr:type II toxin-antitoxin system VapC family toxin [Actinomycetota bacterium]MDQ6910529.1 type II toxin-antitoxin system VapC family toxin [Actinomycetota bacterium]MDQ6945773.1 type II toxin-antitoxin system VapC family toxin [Actinomycetota bacterium]